MRRAPERIDFALYAQAFAVYARNLGVLVPIFIGMVVVIALDLLGNWLWSPIGGAGMPLTGLIANLVQGFAFGVAVISADDAWRHGRVNITGAWDEAKRRAGNILLAVLGFAFLIYVAGLIGGMLPVPYLGYIVTALAIWAFLYTVPAAAIGGIPAGGALSYSLSLAKSYPLATVLLMIVCGIVYYALAMYVVNVLAFIISYYALEAAKLLLTALALGYVAVVMAKQYSDLAFRPRW